MIASVSRWKSVRAVLLGGVLGVMGAGAAVAQDLDAARTATSEGRYVDALAAYAGAIAAAPGDAGVLAQRAQLFALLGQADLAALDYRDAVKLKPEDAGLQVNLCLNLALANHDLDGALAACEAAVKLEPTNYEALSTRGYVQLRRGSWAAAEKDFLSALALNPASPNEMFGHGLAVIKLGRAQEGRDEIASATLDSAGLVSIWSARGFGARGEIRPGKAVTNAGEAIASVDDPRAFLNSDEMLVGPVGVCGVVVPKALLTGKAEVSMEGASMAGECQFGLMHGEWTLAKGGAASTVVTYAYGREIVAGAAGEALARKLALAYQAAERALAP